MNENTTNTIEMTPEQREMALYEQAVEVFGADVQCLKTAEELVELDQALLKYLYYKQTGFGNKDELLNKIAEGRGDVEIMLNQLHVIFGDNTDREIESMGKLEKKIKRKLEGEDA